MSYHCQVALVLTVRASKNLIPNSFFTSPCKEQFGTIVYSYSGCDWTRDREQVAKIETFLSSVANDSFFLIVVGEEPGDVETKGSWELQSQWSLYPVWQLDITQVRD